MNDKEIQKLSQYIKALAGRLNDEDYDWVQGALEGIAEGLEIRIVGNSSIKDKDN